MSFAAHLPPRGSGDLQIFYPQGANTTDSVYQIWHKPRGVRMAYIFGAGGSGGGGAGFSGASLTQRGGGGSGAAAGTFVIPSIPVFMLPDMLFLQIGRGGAGGISGGASAVNGVRTTIAWPAHFVTQTLASASAGNGGGAGTGAAGGPGTSAPSASSFASLWIATAGISTGRAGVAGVTGNATAAGTDVPSNFFTCGGGGAGVTAGNVTARGGIVTSAFPELIPNNAGGAGAVGGGSHGAPGQTFLDMSRFPFHGMGGGGGGSGGTGPGGNGGDARHGCGGGGGGGGNPGGNGGRGGDGLIIIHCW